MSNIITNSLDLLKKISSESEVKVEILKQDGEWREMHCTLDVNKIPEEKRPKTFSISKILSELDKFGNIRVYDLEKEGWRTVKFSGTRWLRTAKGEYYRVGEHEEDENGNP